MNVGPEINWAHPFDKRVMWQAYLNGKIAIRELNSGILQFKFGDMDWMNAE